MDDQDGTPDFLNAIINLEAPQRALFSFGPDPVDVVQDSPLLDLPDEILINIVSRIPVRERIITLGSVCKRLNHTIKPSIKSLHFFTEQLDILPEKKLKYFMSLYGSAIEELNFDLFKSTLDCTQWAWRQSVITTVNLCKNLRELNILVCTRHRLRDTDLKTIFKEAPLLESLSVDAKFINGHCLQDLPIFMKKLEMEMCYRLTEGSLKLLYRLKKLKVLYFSQLLCVKDSFFIQFPRRFRELEDFSLISHQDTVYKGLTAAGLAHIAKLPALNSLSLEGLAAVTDRFLHDLASGPTNNTLKTLSLAFCYNFGSNGVGALAYLKSLENLNLDGVAKRDISSGLDKVAENGQLVRLMIAEKANVCLNSVVGLLDKSSKLRFLDISNNENAINWHTANEMVNSWVNRKNPPLVIFTNDHLAWNCVPKIVPYANGRYPVTVVHVNRNFIPKGEVLPDGILSELGTDDIAPGLNCSRLRRGNLYRFLFEMIEAKSLDFDHVDESPTNDFAKVSPELNDDVSTAGFANFHIQPETKLSGISDQAINRPPFTNLTNGPPSLSSAEIIPQDPKLLFKTFQLSEPSTISMPSNFSFSPVSAYGDPHTQDWSLDVMQYLVGTSAFPDGANVGPMEVREGIVFKPDGLVGYDDGGFSPNSSSTRLSSLASGGAPRPPVEIPEVPDYAYSRGRRKRRSLNHKTTPPKPSKPVVKFNLSENDFPPLS